jgi:hypothetical protein
MPIPFVPLIHYHHKHRKQGPQEKGIFENQEWFNPAPAQSQFNTDYCVAEKEVLWAEQQRRLKETLPWNDTL